MPSAALPQQLHYLLIRAVIETGHAPDLKQLAALAGRLEQDTKQGMRELERIHGVILAPNSLAVWSLHPFALMPTRFWVTARQGGWWANCAWCSLAIGAAIREDISIFTSEGAEAPALEFRVEQGRSTRSDVLMHFPYPPTRWWDNPYCPCGNILFFSSVASIGAWCARHGHPQGAILNIEQGIGLADRWFGDYASPDWQRKTPEQAAKIFSDLGLDPAFWNLGAAFR